MDSEIMVESLPLLGVCTLCLTEGAMKSMLTAPSGIETTKTYAEMLLECFSIDIAQQTTERKWLVCDQCGQKLIDSLEFRQAVENSLQTLSLAINKEEVVIKKVKKEVLESYLDVDDDDDFDHQFASDDDIALNEILIKKEKTEFDERHPKRSKKKVIKLSVKKVDLTETENMLDAGLFPFKLRKNHTFSCTLCVYKTANLDTMKSHVIGEHSKHNIHVAFRKMFFNDRHQFYKNNNVLRCKMCTADLNNFDQLKRHIEECTRIKLVSRSANKWSNLPFKLEKDQLDCPVCRKRFLNFVNLNTHMNVHYPNYICESCGKAFASKARLRGHMRTHEIGRFPCKYCEAVFDRVTKRENHVSKEHKAGVRYACKRCNISLPSFYARQKHLAEVHNEELKRYKCKSCPQSYITPGHLSSHVRRDHLNERNHKCEQCDLAFYTKNALKMHMIKHDGERIHVCQICQKSYQRKKTLREHMRIHDNDKRFVCPVCGRAFTQKCTLKGHLKVHERKVDLDDRIIQPLHSI